MKKCISLLLSIVIILSLATTGCGKTPEPPETVPAQVSQTDVTEPVVPKIHIDFQPKVSSSFLEETYGRDMVEAWYSLVDAVMAGEDTFACPNRHIYIWVLSDFPGACFPVLTEIVEPFDRDENEMVGEGIAQFRYKVSREEAARMIDDFRQLVEGILNEVLEYDYTDFEKALALYRYFSNTYGYDDETRILTLNDPAKANYTSAYRLLTQQIGICSEVAEAYSYLLMQVGVDASVVSGSSDYSEDHEWSIIKLGDRYYHIDPTFVLDRCDYLCYFMMDDEKRAEEGGYYKENYTYVSMYSPEFTHDYSCSDRRCEPLWEGYVETFDHESQTLNYYKFEYEIGKLDSVFDYAGL